MPFALWPTETFFGKKREFLFNGEAVQIIHEPKAHTDGDSLVFFRKSDVVATGDLFTTVMYPFIDVANGGSITGEIDALNAILDITVPSNVNEGGTMVIPGHGRLSDEQDVIEYRDMATIVRDRIKEYVKRGMTLEQVKAKKPTLDFDPRYGTDTGFWTTRHVRRDDLQGDGRSESAGSRCACLAWTWPNREAEGERRMSGGHQEHRVVARAVRSAVAIAVCGLTFAATKPAAQQRARRRRSVADQQGPQTPGAQGQRGRGRGGPAGPVGPARQTAPVDLTGNWVSVVTEDWQWRMMTPKKGDYASVPLSVAGRAEADKWTEANDGQCQAYGVGGIMRMPGRLRISWQDDNTLKIETDAGEQTRLLRFAPVGPPGGGAGERPPRAGRSRARRWLNGSAPAARSTRSSSAAAAPAARHGAGDR